MGVPKLFNSLIQQYHHNPISNPTGYYVIKKKIENDLPSHLYLDFNGAIYQCIKPEIKTEEALILHVVEYLEALCGIVPNLEFVYIALDGSPPLAKSVQQRQRRYHNICKNNRLAKIIRNTNPIGSDTKIDPKMDTFKIDTNMITPGTTFMNNLAIAIRKKCIESPLLNTKHIIFSDSSIPGEGEHKIIQYIRKQGIDTSPHNTIIYALDGDLIFLSLSLHRENTYLFREATEYGNLDTIHGYNKNNHSTSTSSIGGSVIANKRFLYMDVSELTNAIITHFADTYGCSTGGIQERYIDDYIFLGMLLGNDFMPKCHWFSIAEGGFERLLSAYWQIHNHTEIYLVDVETMVINQEMLSDILFIVKEQEQEAVETLFDRRRKARIFIKPDMTEEERQKTLMDFFPLQYREIEQAIEPRTGGWRNRYYNICFHMQSTPENIKLICQNYLKTLVWNFHYYFGECISWDWVYDFPYCPTWADIYEELNTSSGMKSKNLGFKFTLGKPLEPQTLLFMVLPWASRQYMASDIVRKLSDETCPMRIYFPKKYGLNVAFHRYYHECTPILYKIDRDQVEKWIKTCNFTEDELKRNITGKLFVI